MQHLRHDVLYNTDSTAIVKLTEYILNSTSAQYEFCTYDTDQHILIIQSETHIKILNTKHYAQ